MKYAVGLLILLLSTGLFAQNTPPPDQGPQEQMLPEEAELQDWNKAFADAEAVFNSENQTQSIPMYQDLIAKITSEQMKRALTEPEKALLLKSLDHLGQTFFLEGEQDKAGEVFLKLIEADPNYKMNEQLVSSKIIDFVSDIKSQNLGILSITSVPNGATVNIDGVAVGQTDLPSLYTPKGDHEIEINRPGYFPQKQTLTVNPGKTEKLTFKLERSSSVAYFVTYPKGVELRMTGKSLGFTSGEAPDTAQAAATEHNLQVSDFSAEFAIPELQPGEYEVEFVKPCFETPNRKITITANDDYHFAPIIMEPAKATLNITADDSQANIFIDNDYKGIVPKESLDVCPGKHVVKLKGPFGKFEQTIDLKKGQTFNVAAKLNPSLAFLGIVSYSALAKAQIERLRLESVKELQGLKTLNFQDASKTQDHAAIDEAIQEIAVGLEDGEPDHSRQEKISQLCGKLESDLLLFGLIHEKSEDRTVDFYLLSNWSSMPDVRKILVSDENQWERFKSQLEFEYPLYEKRLGINTVDTAITQGPVITKLSLKTFQDAQPLLIGDIVTAIQDKQVKTTNELLADARKMQNESNLQLTVQRSGTQTTVPIQLMLSAMEIDSTDPDLLFNRQLAYFKKTAGLDKTSPQEKNVAALNIGLVYYHFREYEKSLEQIQQVQLDRAVGIGPGTVKYRMALAYRELGKKQEAIQSLTDALRATQNTIGSDDGLPVAGEAQRLQEALNSGTM
jgi:tetratricopeptide (TPR) repeat protein